MQSDDGFTLVETIVSLLLLTIIVMGFFNVYFSLQKYNKYTEQKRLSFQLCQSLLVQLEKDEYKYKEGKIMFNKKRLKNLSIDNIKEYSFIDNLIIDFKPLVIEGNHLKELAIAEFKIKWRDHNFDFYTIVKTGGKDNL